MFLYIRGEPLKASTRAWRRDARPRGVAREGVAPDLDAVGDLYLAGRPIIGAYEGFKSGHALNNKLVRALMADATAWEWVTYDSPAVPDPVVYATPAYA